MSCSVAKGLTLSYSGVFKGIYPTSMEDTIGYPSLLLALIIASEIIEYKARYPVLSYLFQFVKSGVLIF